jgi:uncharacterized protein (UPF0218 family)
MRDNDIVFAPLGKLKWPARILTVGEMTTVKFFKNGETHKVPKDFITAFNSINIAVYKKLTKDKAFTVAVKQAEEALRQLPLVPPPKPARAQKEKMEKTHIEVKVEEDLYEDEKIEEEVVKE